MGVYKPFEVKVGSSAITLTEYSNGAAIWLDGSNGDFTGGDYFGIHAYGTTDLAFGYAGGTKMTLKNDGKLGIGISTPDTNLHVWKASAGSVSAASDAQLVVENSGVAAINLLSPATSHGQIIFGDPDDNDAGQFGYDHSTNLMYFKVNGSNTKIFKVDSSTATFENNIAVNGTGTFTKSSGDGIVLDGRGSGSFNAANIYFKSGDSDGSWNAYRLKYVKDANNDRLEFIDGSGNPNIIFNNGGRAVFARSPGANWADPTISFGDGDSGFYEASDDVIRIAIAGAHSYGIDSSAIQGNASNRFAIRLDTPTSTVPNFTPNKNDSNTLK